MESKCNGDEFDEVATAIHAKLRELDVLERVEHLQQELDATRKPAAAKFVRMCGTALSMMLSIGCEEEPLQKAMQKVYMAKRFFWEETHAVYWKDVASTDRDGYALACLTCAINPAAVEQVTLLVRLRDMDMGLLLGAELFRSILQFAAQIIHDRITPTWSPQPALASQADSRRLLQTDHPVPVLDQPSLHQFFQYMLEGKPVLIRGMMEDWPCSTRWKDIAYLRHLMGFRTVPVEIGSHYLTEDWGQKLLTVNEFIDQYLTGNAETRGYLAQHQLLDQIHRLNEDIVVPDYCSMLLPAEEDRPDAGDTIVNAWFGPATTVSPLHNDPYHNLFAQVVGCKYFRLYAPSESDKLYPREGTMSNNSMVDVSAPDLEQFPRFAQAQYSECIVNEGELLYLPPKYWHYVQAVSPSDGKSNAHPLQQQEDASVSKRPRVDPIYSFSISFWWGIRREETS